MVNAVEEALVKDWLTRGRPARVSRGALLVVVVCAWIVPGGYGFVPLPKGRVREGMGARRRNMPSDLAERSVWLTAARLLLRRWATGDAPAWLCLRPLGPALLPRRPDAGQFDRYLPGLGGQPGRIVRRPV